MSERAGFDAATWRLVRPFTGRVATPADVEDARAVFALSDTVGGRPLEAETPQPVIWRGEDEDFAALLIQAERHESEDGVEMQVAGLLLPSGDTAVALMEDIESVPEDDPVWLSLLEADLEGWDGEDWEEDDDDDLP